MMLLFLSWRDIRSPKSGGAEVHTHGLMKCFVAEGCEVIHFAPLYEGLVSEEIIEGIKYIRKGNIFSVILWAQNYYRNNQHHIDYVVDQCNTHRFFSRFWVPQSKRIFYIHQLTREIWDINLPFPFSWIGKHLENAMLRLQKNDITIALSESTKEDLLNVGFDPDLITVIPIAISDSILNYGLKGNVDEKKDFIYVGRYSKYKGINDAIEAFGIVKKHYSDCKLYVVGKKDEEFIKGYIAPCATKYNITYGDEDNSDVVLTGFVSEEEKFRLMKKSRVLLFPSVREGWGIIVTEAAALGTPSIVYDNPGCRDAVSYGRAGYLCNENTSDQLAFLMENTIIDKENYKTIQIEAYNYAQEFSWNNNQIRVKQFLSVLKGCC